VLTTENIVGYGPLENALSLLYESTYGMLVENTAALLVCVCVS